MRRVRPWLSLHGRSRGHLSLQAVLYSFIVASACSAIDTAIRIMLFVTLVIVIAEAIDHGALKGTEVLEKVLDPSPSVGM